MAEISITDLEEIRDEAVARLKEVLAQPKPDYSVDGQSFKWAEYVKHLRDTIAWTKTQIVEAGGVWEETSEAVT